MHNSFRPSKTIVSLLFAALAGLGNPALIACSHEGGDFQFNDDDMAAAVEGTFTGYVDGKRVTLTLERSDQAQDTLDRSLQHTIESSKQRSLQCGSRSFVKSASACISTSTLSIDAAVTSESDALPSGALSGWFTVWGNNLTQGDLTFDGKKNHILDATFRDGVLRDWTLTKPDGTTLAVEFERAE